MLRPIDKLSEIVGFTGLVRADRLEREADKMDKAGDTTNGAIDRRHHAKLIREIHRLSNPDFQEG